jgi:hypothetical protein
MSEEKTTQGSGKPADELPVTKTGNRKMNPSTKNRVIRLIIYFIVVFIAAFLYSYFKRD